MPVHLAPIFLLAGVGLAAVAKKRSKLKKPTVGTSGEFAVVIMFADEKQAEFAYGLMREIRPGPMQAGAITLDIGDQYYSVGKVVVHGSFTSTKRMSTSFAYVTISQRIEEILRGFSEGHFYTLDLFDVKGVSVLSQWDAQLVASCSRMLEDFRQDEERFRGVAVELSSKLRDIAQEGNIIDQDMVDISLELLNREVPGCQFRVTRESNLKGAFFIGLVAGDGSGFVSEAAFKAFSTLVRYGYIFLSDEDIPIGFNAAPPSLIPDFVKLKMDQFRPISELA